VSGPARATFVAGTAAIGVGMVLVCGGVRVGALFLPGVFLLGLGFLALTVGAVLGVATSPGDA
jgi:hypothetical protein